MTLNETEEIEVACRRVEATLRRVGKGPALAEAMVLAKAAEAIEWLRKELDEAETYGGFER